MRDLESVLGQTEIITSILEWLENTSSESKLLVLRGNSGTGKTHIVKEVAQQWENRNSGRKYIHAQGDSSCKERALFPLITSLEKARKLFSRQKMMEQGYSQMARSIPQAGIFLSYLFDLLVNRGNDLKKEKLAYLNLQEQEILLSFNSYYRGSDVFLIADNFHWWDQSSISLINFILSGTLDDLFPFVLNLKIVLVITDDQIAEPPPQNIQSLLLKYPHNALITKPLSKEDFRAAFQLLGGESKINTKTQNLLFSLTGGHLELIKKLALLPEHSLNDYNDLFSNESIEDGNSQELFLEKILVTRLQFLGAESDQIIKVLEYASVIGFTFSYEEILCLAKDEEQKIKGIILRAKEASLIESDASQNNFSHEVIREFFIHRIGIRKYEYYRNFAACLRLLRPSEYFERAGLLFEAGAIKESLTLYIIGILKNVRDGLLIPATAILRIENLAEEHHLLSYYLAMREAYSDFNKGKYKSAREHLEGLEDIYPDVLVAEKYYLLSLCMAKNLQSDDLLRAKNYLLEWDKLRQEESEVWVRIMLTLMSRHAHLNEYDKADLIERKLMSFLNQRIPFDSNALQGINVLRRKASILHKSEIACGRTEESLIYFGHEFLPGVYRNPVQYYMALTNHSGNLIMSGRFESANIFAEKSLALQKIYPELLFPRIEVALNNYIVSGFLHHKLNASQCVQLYDSLFLNINNPNDRVLLRNNYIIICALDGKIELALEMSNKLLELLSQSSRKDDYYNYFVGVNHAILIYLTKGRTQAIQLLEALLPVMPSIPDKVFMSRRHELIVTLIKEAGINDPIIWQNYMLSTHPQELGPAWSFWGQGFLFTDMQFWSDS